MSFVTPVLVDVYRASDNLQIILTHSPLDNRSKPNCARQPFLWRIYIQGKELHPKPQISSPPTPECRRSLNTTDLRALVDSGPRNCLKLDVRNTKITWPNIRLRHHPHGIVSLAIDGSSKLPSTGGSQSQPFFVRRIRHVTNRLLFIILLPAPKQLGPVTPSFALEILTAKHIFLGLRDRKCL